MTFGIFYVIENEKKWIWISFANDVRRTGFRF